MLVFSALALFSQMGRIPTLQKRKLRFREVKGCDQGHSEVGIEPGSQGRELECPYTPASAWRV